MKPPVTLRVAAALVVVMTVGELVYVASRDELTVGLRIGLMVVVAVQVVFAQGALRFGAGSALGLFACEFMTVVAAIGGRGPVAIRVVLAAAAITVAVLLARSLRAFPSPTTPLRR